MKEMNLLKFNKAYLGLSIVTIFCGLALFAVFNLKLSIDFTGGSISNYSLEEGFDAGAVEQDLIASYEEAQIEVTAIRINENVATVRTLPMKSQQNEQLITNVSYNQTSFETVGSVIGAEALRKAVTAVGISLVAILLFIAYAFRNIPSNYSSFKFGLAALYAMAHDVLIVVGVFALLGQISGVEIDMMFITALLTIIGFSVNDTIVVFDRIRENLKRYRKNRDFEWIANASVIETLRRSLGTSFTVVVVLLALLVFGGASVKYFSLALLIGIISGTYSSIFVATPLLVIMQQGSFGKHVGKMGKSTKKRIKNKKR